MHQKPCKLIAVLVQTEEYADTYVIDTADGSSDSSKSLTEATQLIWVFDDMLIGMTKSGIKAFVPASS